MTPATYIAAAFLLVLLGTGCLVSLLMDARAENRRLRLLVSDLRSDLGNAVEVADHWKRKYQGGRYREPVFQTVEEWRRAVELEQLAARSLPGAEVVELPRRGGGA